IIVRKCYGMPNAVERIVQNISVGSQILFGSLNSILQFFLGNLDSYAGLGIIIKEYYEAIEQHKESPVSVQKAKKLLEITEEIFKENKLDEDLRNPLKGLLAKKPEVLVTGGTGLIGRRLVKRLIKEGNKVRVFSHRKLSQQEIDELYQGDVEVFRGDIYKFEDVREACKGIKAVYHLAAAMKGDWNYHMDTTITGTRNVLSATDEAKVKQLIYVSTLNVYDARNYPNNKNINESFQYEDQPHNRGNYSNAKLQAEKIVREFTPQTSMTISIIRPGLVYGPGFKPFPGDVGLRLGKNFVVVFGMGLRKLPLVYVDNLVDVLILMQKKIVESGEIFHLVDGERVSQRHYIKNYKKIAKESFLTVYVPLWFVSLGFMTIEGLVKLLMGKKVSLNYKLQCVAKSPIFNSENIQKKLAWQQNIDFSTGLTRTIHGDAG
ncbi:MAG: SDR family NAD(P)-dependent oxidoreductase, partial [Candidatus Omnitrophica bacterium]|nr:SDR family NAD(P)-dependent oxidoreductase [Candidatus Omnitrophota bacterium]